MKLNVKVTALIVLVAAIALLSSYYIYSSSVSSDIMPKIQDRYLKEAGTLMRATDIFLDGARTDLLELSNNPVIKDDGSSQAAIRQELLKFKDKKKYFKSVSFFDLNGIKLAGTDDAGIGQAKNITNFRNDFSQKKKYSFQNSLSSTTENPIAEAGYLIENSGLPIGFIIAEIDMSDIKKLFGSSEGAVALLDKNGNIILTNNPLYKQVMKLDGLDSFKEGSSGKSGTLYEYNQYLKSDVFTAFAGEKDYKILEENRWMVIYSVNKNDMPSSSSSSKGSIIFAGIFVVLLAIIFSHYLTKELEKPMKDLESKMNEAIVGKDIGLPMVGLNSADSVKYLESMINDLNTSRKVIDEYSRTVEQRVGVKTKEIEETKSALVGALDDMSKTKEALNKKYATLKEQNDLKNQFLSIAAHELKTPLSVIHGFSDVMLKNSGDGVSEKSKNFLKIISKESLRLSQLVTDILDLSRVDLGTVKYDLVVVDPAPMLRDSATSMEMQFEQKGLKFEHHIDGELPKVAVDQDKFTQVLVNLLTNAMKYTLKGKVMFDACEKDGSLYIKFEDTGIGMSPEGMKKLFQRFYRVETEITKTIPGTGLGLSLCKEYIEAMGGKIWAESEVGKGSKFHITIPAKK